MSLYCPKRHHQVKEHMVTRDSLSNYQEFDLCVKINMFFCSSDITSMFSQEDLER